MSFRLYCYQELRFVFLKEVQPKAAVDILGSRHTADKVWQAGLARILAETNSCKVCDEIHNRSSCRLMTSKKTEKTWDASNQLIVYFRCFQFNFTLTKPCRDEPEARNISMILVLSCRAQSHPWARWGSLWFVPNANSQKNQIPARLWDVPSAGRFGIKIASRSLTQILWTPSGKPHLLILLLIFDPQIFGLLHDS